MIIQGIPVWFSGCALRRCRCKRLLRSCCRCGAFCWCTAGRSGALASMWQREKSLGARRPSRCRRTFRLRRPLPDRPGKFLSDRFRSSWWAGPGAARTPCTARCRARWLRSRPLCPLALCQRTARRSCVSRTEECGRDSSQRSASTSVWASAASCDRALLLTWLRSLSASSTAAGKRSYLKEINNKRMIFS